MKLRTWAPQKRGKWCFCWRGEESPLCLLYESEKNNKNKKKTLLMPLYLCLLYESGKNNKNKKKKLLMPL